MQKIKSIVRWFVYSSADKEKLSNTIKGVTGFMVVASTALAGLGIGSAQITQEDGELLADALVTVAQYFGLAITSVYAAAGLVRKIYLTYTGKADK